MVVSKEKKKLYNERYREKLRNLEEKSNTSSNKTSDATPQTPPQTPPQNEQTNFFFPKNLREKVKEQLIMSTIPIIMGLIYKTVFTISSKISLKQQSKESQQEQATQLQMESLNIVNF